MILSFRRGALAVAVSALTLSTVPAAQAAPGVCNQASPQWLGGGLVALDLPVNSPAARYTVDIGKLPGKGAGLFEAAAHSPSLTICDGGGGGGTTSSLVIIDEGAETPVEVSEGVVEITS